MFLAGRDRYTQRTLHRDTHDRLDKQPGCTDVRYRPSRRRPRTVVADVETTTFLGCSSRVAEARLEVRFGYPPGVGYEYYRINWIEPERAMMLGFHRDGDHPGVGGCHVQLDHRDTSVDRHGVTVLDDHPLAVLDERLQQLPSALAAIEWRDGRPSLPRWPV